MRFCFSLLLTLVSGTALAGDLLINGAGATFPYPLYSKWFNEYARKKPGVKLNYQSIGSGGGIKQITEKTVDFGASDAPMTDKELERAPGVIHIPTVVGAIAVVMNGPPGGLKLPAGVLADVFLGKVARWNDPRVAAANPGAKLPDQAIAVVHRSDGSGTTYVFTDYLSKISPEWRSKVGTAKSVKWPVGLGVKGNEGVTGMVKATPGAIGYVELAYASQNKLPVAAIENADGSYVEPSIESTSTAAAGVELPADFRVSITNPKGKDAYPIAAFTYLLVRQEQEDAQKGKALVDLLWWAIHDGQVMAAPLGYAPLPRPVVQKVERLVKGMTVQGRRVM